MCQPLDTYLRGLSFIDLSNIVQEYRTTGIAPSRTCGCSGQKTTTSTPRPVAPPSATCRLLPEGSKKRWPHDVDPAQPEALDWVMRRMQERDVEASMKQSWVDHPKQWWRSAAFIPSAQFPRKRDRLLPGNGNKTVFGPCQQRTGAIKTLLVLNSYDSPPRPPPPAANNLWLSYLDRTCTPSSRSSAQPPLTPVVGVMVSEPQFTDSQAKALLAPYWACDVQLLPATSWDEATFTVPIATKASDPISFRNIQGVTVLFLACYVIGDDDSLNKLLQMRQTGSAILKDLIHNGLSSILDDRVYSCTKSLIRTAMQEKTDWNLEALCCQLSLWFDVWTNRKKTALLHAVYPLQIEELVEDLFGLWRERPFEGRRVFSPDTAGGWEDAAEVTLLGAYYGSAVGTIVLIALGRIEAGKSRIAKRESRVRLGTEWSTNCQSILCAVLNKSVSIKTDATSEALLDRINSRIVKANKQEILNIRSALDRVKAKLCTVTQSFNSFMDGQRLTCAFQQAFTSVVTQNIPIEPETVHAFFGGDVAEVSIATLRSGSPDRYNADFSHLIFEDLESRLFASRTDKELAEYMRMKNRPKTSVPPSTRLNPMPIVQKIEERKRVQKLREAERSAEQRAMITARSTRLALPASEAVTTTPPSPTHCNDVPLTCSSDVSSSTQKKMDQGQGLKAPKWPLVVAGLAAIVGICAAYYKPKFATSAFDRLHSPLPDLSGTVPPGSSSKVVMARVTDIWEFADKLHVSAGDMVELVGKPADGWYSIKVSSVDKPGVRCTT